MIFLYLSTFCARLFKPMGHPHHPGGNQSQDKRQGYLLAKNEFPNPSSLVAMACKKQKFSIPFTFFIFMGLLKLRGYFCHSRGLLI